MQIFIFTYMTPILPFLIRKQYKKDEKKTFLELAVKYGIYTLCMTIFVMTAMVFLCEKDTSFFEKMDTSPIFALKYFGLEIAAAAIVALLEWIYETKKISLMVAGDEFKNHPAVRFYRKILAGTWVYILAGITVIMNISLIFDNVLWGDEAYSAILVKKSIADMMQIISLEEPHPPLYYLWLKLCSEILGYQGPVYHFASILPFLLGLVLALTLVRKRFGNIPAAFFVIIAGMASPCLEYNVEIRMYSLAFMSVVFCYFAAYDIIKTDKKTSWVMMSVFGLIGAYTHYYAALAIAILMGLTYIVACFRYRKKTWIRVMCSLVFCIGAYLPWLSVLFSAMRRVESNWWMTSASSLNENLTEIFGGETLKNIILPVLLVIMIVILIAESSVFKLKNGENKKILEIHAPKSGKWSPELIIMLIGTATIFGTLVVAYLACVLVRPVLTARYVYPLAGLTAIMLSIGSGHLLGMFKIFAENFKNIWLYWSLKIILVVIIIIMFFIGVKNYATDYTEVKTQKEKTTEILTLMGSETDALTFVNNGISHIGWTVLAYYYPDADIYNSTFRNVDADDFWYFTPGLLSQDEKNEITTSGYTLTEYGSKQLVKYTFMLYHFSKNE